MNLIEKIDKLTLEAKGGIGSPFKLNHKPSQIVGPGKKQYYISLENPSTGKVTDGYVITKNIAMIHKVAADKGWIITKHYEK